MRREKEISGFISHSKEKCLFLKLSACVCVCVCVCVHTRVHMHAHMYACTGWQYKVYYCGGCPKDLKPWETDL